MIFKIINTPSKADFLRLTQNLTQYNNQYLGPAESFIILMPNNIQNGVIAYYHKKNLILHTIWIEEKYRRLGYGRQLLEALEDEGRKREMKNLTTEIYSFQSSEFYLKQGFKIIAEIKDYYENYDRIIFRKDL